MRWRYIIEEEQKGIVRAKYGKKILDELSNFLTDEFGRGFSRTNVASMRKFYLVYKERQKYFPYIENEDQYMPLPIMQTVSAQFEKAV